MTTIYVTTDSIPAIDLANCVEALNRTLLKWCPKWNLTATATTDPKIKADMVIKVTDINRHTGAYGYHTVENKIPTAYCSPRAIGRTYGHFTPALWTKPKKNLLGKVVAPAQMVHDNLYTEGLVTVIIHEALEMLADANINTVSKPDVTGAQWLIEVCDHVSGSYSVEVVQGNNCIVPNATLPNYYDLNGVAPFDLLGLSKTPFDTNAPKFYGYSKDAKGVLTAIPKGSIRHA